MPSSLIIVALVVAWLLVLVPIVARKRQEVARTADSTLAARVVRSGGVRTAAVEGEPTMSDAGEADTARESDQYEADGLDAEDFDEADFEEVDFEPAQAEGETEHYDDAENRYEDENVQYEDDAEYEDDYEGNESRPYRPGRGGFDPEAAASIARARYTFRQRVVVFMLMAALVTGIIAAVMSPVVWWAHAAIDAGLIGYLGYLRRQVRIEEEIRQRRTARLGTPQRRQHAPVESEADDTPPAEAEEPPTSSLPQRRPLVRQTHPGTVVVDTDDEDPVFAELEEPGALPYRRAVGE
jgi:hypothetical protein